MQHRNSKNKLGRNTTEKRKALLRSLAESLFKSEKVCTTLSRAKALQGFVDRLFVKVKGKDKFNAIREIKKVAFTVDSGKRAFEICQRLSGKNSGFTKLVLLGERSGDGAKMAQVQFA